MKSRRSWGAIVLLALSLVLTSIQPAATAPPNSSDEPTVAADPSLAEPAQGFPSPTTDPAESTSSPSPTPVNPAPSEPEEPSPAPAPENSPPAPGPSQSIESTPDTEALSAGEAAIEAEWQRLGGAAGTMGSAVSPTECGLSQNGCRRQFANGKIHWTSATGAVATSGAIATVWATHGEASGRLGYPVESYACAPGATTCQQSFQSGFIVWSQGIGTFAVYSPYSRVWTSFGGSAGRLGVPVGTETCDSSGAGCSQQFQRGLIIWVAGSGTSAVHEPYLSVWAASGKAAGRLGYPVGNEVCSTNGSGCAQQFQKGYIAWVPGVGTTLLAGVYATTWSHHGGAAGPLGYPVAPEACGLVKLGCFQQFAKGAIYWNSGNGAYPVYGGYSQIWSKYGREGGRLGYPVSSEKCGLAGSGCVQSFQGGYVYWAAGIGFHSVYGVYGQVWGSKRAQDGALGYPVSEEECQSTSCTQRFEGGWIQWIAGQGAGHRYSEWGYCRALNVGATKYSGGGAARVAFAVSQGYGTTPVTFTNCVKRDGRYVHDWTAAGYAGESGFARPGAATGPTTGKYSPTGSYSFTLAFGLSNPGTSLPYQTLNPYSRWGGRLNSNYNKYFESSADIFPDENMWYYATRPSGDYRQGAVINYNRPPDSEIVMNAGFAIFLHANPVPTWGCISLTESNVVRFLRTASSGDRLIMGVSNDVFE